HPPVLAAIPHPRCPGTVSVAAHRSRTALRAGPLDAPNHPVSTAARPPQWQIVGELVHVPVRRPRRIDDPAKPHGPFSLGTTALATLATVLGACRSYRSRRGLGRGFSLCC